MSEPPAITPDYFQILVLRELRKVGFDVGQPRTHRRSELPDPERGEGFVLELVIPLAGVAAIRRALVVCRKQAEVVGRDIVESTLARLAQTGADAAMIFATSGFAPDAVAAARAGGAALLQIAEGRTVFDAGGWGGGGGGGDGTPDHYPAWLPAHMAQLVDHDAVGQPRARVLEAGRTDMILDAMRSGTHG